MEEGSFRCDANVSVMPEGSQELGAKVEVKNMNSFRAVYRALEFEVQRQVAEVESGGRIVQETRGWDDDRGVTVSQRSKEFAHDYRYFPEPDLPPLALSPEWVENLKARLPELPDARLGRFVTQYGLSYYDASALTASRVSADYFEEAVDLGAGPKAVANWVLNDLLGHLNAAGQGLEASKVGPRALADLIRLVDSGAISSRMAKEVFEEMFQTGRPPAEIVSERGLSQISDEAAIEQAVDQVLAANASVAADYLGGKAQALGFLVGQVMKLTRGKANPGLVNRQLVLKLTQMSQGGGPSGA
jgi:aspartyl-tRNA(Asn)/glutamyl-tRNA(Gln) amidotransferase subunit B